MKLEFYLSIYIPVLAFFHSKPNGEAELSDISDPIRAEKFFRFRNEVTEKRMVKMWEDSSSLPALPATA